MKLIIGLGNPGEKYEKTRHNLGFMIVERFLKDFEPVKTTSWENSAKFKSDIAQIEWQRQSNQKSSIRQAQDKNQKLEEGVSLEKVILVKPKTYMNNSGMAVQLITSYFKLLTVDVWVVHDDIDLPLEAMKIRFGGASAGHHGVESVMEHLKTDKFWRFRMGVGEGKSNLKNQISKIKNVENYVLGNFVGQEKGKLKHLIKRGVNGIETALEDGLDSAMNRFNTK